MGRKRVRDPAVQSFGSAGRGGRGWSGPAGWPGLLGAWAPAHGVPAAVIRSRRIPNPARRAVGAPAHCVGGRVWERLAGGVQGVRTSRVRGVGRRTSVYSVRDRLGSRVRM